MTPSVARTKVFVSYSHKDAEFLQRLQVHLAPDTRENRVVLWDDTTIRPGAKWRTEINQAMASAKVAVLLVSADFLASDFIARNELPPLLSAAEAEGVTILPVLLKPCRYSTTPLAEFQFVNKPLIPLARMDDPDREETWVRVAEAITDALNTPLPPTSFPSTLPSQSDTQQTLATQETIEERYRQALLSDASVTKLKVLNMSSPLPISNIYVRLQVHEDMQHKYHHIPSKQQATKDPFTLIQQRERLLEGRFRMAMEPTDALLKHNQSVIVGDPGAGKTTLLKYLTIQAVNKLLPDMPRVPLYIRLNAFAISNDGDLLMFAARTWEQEYGIEKGEARVYIEEQIKAGNVLLLLDALDEAAVGSTIEEAEASYKRVADEITRLSKRCSWIVVTARKAGYYQRARLHAFRDLEILDFRIQEIEQFIDNWFLYHPREDRRGDASGLKQSIKSNPYVQTLAANPLLLTLITLVYEDEMTLPERRATLYKKCVETLLSRWDTSRSISRPRRLKLEYQLPLLQEIAWHMHSQGLRYVTEDTLLPIISRFLPTIGRNAGQAQEILTDISGDNGLLREQGEGIYGFLHLTLQEYFTSQYITDVSVLLAHLNDPWWEEVILLYTGGEAHDATPLLEHLLVVEGPGEIPEDIFACKLLLAGRCLATHPTIRNIVLWDDIPERLFKKLLQTNYALTRQQVANTLAEIGRAFRERDINQHLLALLTSTSSNITIRMSIATALGTYGAREVATDLLEFLAQAETPLNDVLRNTVGEAMAQLADRSLLPRFIELISDKNTDPLIGTTVVYCIGSIGDAALVPMLLTLLSNKTLDLYLRAALAYNTARIGDAATISSLVTFLAAPTTEEEIVDIALIAFSSQRHRVAAPALLHLLAQPERSVDLRTQVASTLGAIGDQSTIQGLVPLVYDAALDINVRVACASALTQCAIRTRQSTALTLLADEALDTRIRMAIAYALAQSEDRRLPIELRSLQIRTQDEQVRTALLITTGILGDYSVHAKLLELLLREPVPTHLRLSIANAILPSISDSRLVTILTDAQIDANIRVTLVQALAATGSHARVPYLLKIVADPVVIEEVRVSAAEAIGLLGEKKASVEKMRDAWRFYDIRDPMRVSVLVDTMYQALWAMSRRVGVMIVQAGTDYKVLDL